MKMRWVCLISLALATCSGLADSYTITIPAGGCKLIANQLDNPAGNTLANIMPSLPCDCRLMKYDNASNTWITTTYSTAWGWANGAITLDPGQGAFLCSCCATNFTITFSGTPHVPVLPINIPPGQAYLLSRQTPAIGTYDTIVGLAPVGGAKAWKWNGSWQAYQYDPDELVWIPTDWTAAVGEALWISPSGATPPAAPDVPCPTNCVEPLTLTCATNKIVPCTTNWSFDAPTVLDPCCGTNYTLTFTTVTNGTFCSNVFTRTWHVTDCSNRTATCTQTVTVVDTNPPVFTYCPTNKTVVCGSAWSFEAPTASDACCGTNVAISIFSTVTNGICPWVITRTWRATDCCANTATCTQVVTLVDTNPPVFTYCPTNKTVVCGSAWSFDVPTASDACCGTNVTISVFSTVTNGMCPWVITRTWRATDCCANTATCTQVVTVVNTNGPVIQCPSEIIVNSCTNTRVYYTVTATNNCCTNVTVVCTPPSGSLFEVNTPTWVCCVATEDCCTNRATNCFLVVVECDTNCYTPLLTLNTGFNEVSGATYAVGDTDRYWTLVANPDILAPEIRPAWVIAPYPSAWEQAQPNSQWISAYRTAKDDLNGTNDFEVLFCLNTNATHLRLELWLRADDWAQVFLNGNYVGATPSPSFNTALPTYLTDNIQAHFNKSGPLPNNHLLVHVVNQYSVAMGLNLVGSVTGFFGLLSNTPACCQTNLSIAGSKFNDLNANGVWDQNQGEPAIPNWYTIVLHDQFGAPIQSAHTDGYGDYYFMHLPPGTYTVSENPGSGYTQTYPSGSQVVYINNGAGAVNINFGNSLTNTPTNCCKSAVVYASATDFTGNGTLCNLFYDNGHLTFPPYIKPLPFVNMSCHGRGTLVRIDANATTSANAVLGEYYTGPATEYPNGSSDPSRVTVDLYGNVWVANRQDVLRGTTRYGSVTCYALVIGGTRCNKYGTGDPLGQYLKPPFLYNSGAVSRHVKEVGEIAGLLKTSRGLNDILLWPANGTSQEDGFNGTVKWADDDCIIHYTLVSGWGARTLAVTAGNDIWVGGYDNYVHRKLHGVNGTPVVLDGRPVVFDPKWWVFFGMGGAGGYGGFVDPNNVLWSARGHLLGDLLRVDLNQAQSYSSYWAGVDLGNTHGNYGIAIDPCSTNIWLSDIDHGTAYVRDAAGAPHAGPYPTVGPYPTADDGCCTVFAQGLAVDDRGNVWVAHGRMANTVAHLYSGSRGTTMGDLANPGDPSVHLDPLGSLYGPTGVAIDSNGKVWVSCYNSSKAMRINPGANLPVGGVDLEVDLGQGAQPYNYSDMTGFISLGVTRPSGFWDFIQDACPTNIEWGIITWSACPDTQITVQVRADDQWTDLPKHDWLSVQNGISFCGHGILGAYLEVRVSMDRGTNCACTNSSACLERLSVQCCKDSTWQTNGQSSISIPLSPVSVSNAVPLTTNLWVGVTQPGGLAFHVAWSVNGQPVVTDQIPRGTPPTQTNVGFLYIYPLGSNSVSVVVSDGINPPVYDQTSVIVGDVTPPKWGVLPAYTTNAFAASVPNVVASVDTNSVRDDWSSFAQITLTQDVTPGTVLTQGAYFIALVATDAAGNSSTNVTAITVGPVLSITSPKNYASFPNNVPTPVTVQIQANVTDVVRVNYYLDDNLVATSTNAPYGVSLTGVPPGSYSLVAEAVNPAGLTSRSGAVRIGFVGPATIQIQLTGGQVRLDWPPAEGWILQSADRVTGPWNDVVGATNPFLVTPTGLSQFYRLRLGP